MPIAESSASILIAACVGMLSSLLAAVIPDPAAAAAGIVIMDDTRLRLICIAGSLGGAVVSVMLFSVTTHKELARKLTVSSLSGVIFSPVIMRYIAVPASTDYVLVISAVTALLSWSALQTVVPMAIERFITWLGVKVPKAPANPLGNGEQGPPN